MNYDDLLEVTFEKNYRDCRWLCGEIYKRLGKKVPDWDEIIKEWSIKELNEQIRKHKHKFISLKIPEPYCLVSFWVVPFLTTHIGVVLEDCKKFIHILKQSSVTVENLVTGPPPLIATWVRISVPARAPPARRRAGKMQPP